MLSRLETLLGKEVTDKFKNSFVVVCGLGGVGGHCIDALVRSGIGKIRLVDADVFETSNINRQLYSTYSNIGQPKTECVKQRILEINPFITVETLTLFATSENMNLVLKDKPDLVVDAIDSLSSKCTLLKECISNNIPVVSSMGAALKTDPLKIEVSDISKTHTCPLARSVRKNLAQMGIYSGIKCVFSTEKSIHTKDNILGSYCPVTGSFGLILADVALKTLSAKL